MLLIAGGRLAAAEKSAEKSGEEAIAYTHEDQQRILGLMPNYRTTSIDQKSAKSLTLKEKFKIATKDAFDSSAFYSTILYAGMGQWGGQYSSLGGGVKGFSSRYGLMFADSVQGTYLTEAVFPTLFRQDPRYFRKGEGNVFGRAAYSLSRLAVTRADNGKLQINGTELAGNFAVSSISNLYYPASERTMENVVVRFSSTIASDAMNNLVREFWPDVVKMFHRHKGPKNVIAATPTPRASESLPSANSN